MPPPSPVPDVIIALTEAGGIAPFRALVEASSKSAVRCALDAGAITRLGPGVYALTEIATAKPPERAWSDWDKEPTTEETAALACARGVARAYHGALSHLSAAAQYGWPALTPPTEIEIVVRPDRRVTAVPGIRRRRRRVSTAELASQVTSPARTVLDCAIDLPLPDALAVADSALRSGGVGRGTLELAADRLRGPGVTRARRVIQLADARSANPFESALRAHALTVPGFEPVPQYAITDGAFAARVDLADPALRIVLEAESFRYHGSAERFARDVTRYTGLVERDWTVLRFGLDEVRQGTPVTTAVAAAVYLRRFGPNTRG